MFAKSSVARFWFVRISWARGSRLVLAAGLLTSFAAAAQGETEMLKFAGSSTMQPVIERAARLFEQAHPAIRCEISASGSGDGVSAAGDGRVDIGMCSRELKESEANKYPEILGYPVGFDGIGIIVHADNPLSEIGYEQIRDIYTGKLINWKQLGGAAGTIARFARHDDSSSQDMFVEYFGLQARLEGPAEKSLSKYRRTGAAAWGQVAATGTYSKDEIIDGIVGNRHAIGFVSLMKAESVITKGVRIKMLNLDGAVASGVNVANESYPLRRTLQLLVTGEPTGSAKLFLDFMLSPQGQELVKEMEFVPANP